MCRKTRERAVQRLAIQPRIGGDFALLRDESVNIVVFGNFA